MKNNNCDGSGCVAMATNTRNMSAKGDCVTAATSPTKASAELTTEVVSTVEKLEDLGECFAFSKNLFAN